MKFRVVFPIAAFFFLSVLQDAKNQPPNPFKSTPGSTSRGPAKPAPQTQRVIKGAIPQLQQSFYRASSTTAQSPFLRPPGAYKVTPKHVVIPKHVPQKHKKATTSHGRTIAATPPPATPPPATPPPATPPPATPPPATPPPATPPPATPPPATPPPATGTGAVTGAATGTGTGTGASS